ncbi:Immunoglobulin I-set domain containing protein, partial [Aphelenchoides avenae]
VGSVEAEYHVEVIRRPSLARTETDIARVVQGEAVTITCPVQDKFDGHIVWLKDEQAVIDDNRKFSTTLSNRKLTVHKADPSDEGAYLRDFKLEVLTPPIIRISERDRTRSIVENNTLVLSCPVTGKPEPTITWLKDGEKLPNALSSEYVVPKVQSAHSGRYTCEAKNDAGTAEQDINVDVMTPPQIQWDKESLEVSGQLNSRVTIYCPVYGHPSPTLTWLKNGRPLDDPTDIYLSSNRQRLHFIRLQKHDADQYTCIARNAAGEDRKDFQVRLL